MYVGIWASRNGSFVLQSYGWTCVLSLCWLLLSAFIFETEGQTRSENLQSDSKPFLKVTTSPQLLKTYRVQSMARSSRIALLITVLLAWVPWLSLYYLQRRERIARLPGWESGSLWVCAESQHGDSGVCRKGKYQVLIGMTLMLDNAKLGMLLRFGGRGSDMKAKYGLFLFVFHLFLLWLKCLL